MAEIASAPEVDISLKLAYDSPSGLHQTIITKLNEMRKLSNQYIATRKPAWNEVDRRLRGFIDLSKMAKLADGTRSSTALEMPYERAIVVPVTASMLDVRRSQMLGIFNARDPMTQVQPTEGSDVKSAHAIEMNLDYDHRASRILVGMNTFFGDKDKYGEGWFYNGWQRDYGIKLQAPVYKGFDGFKAQMLQKVPMVGMLPAGVQDMALNAMMKHSEKTHPELFRPVREHGLKREYNLSRCIDPSLMIRDPRAPSWDPDKHEFCGHTDYQTWAQLWDERREAGGLFFNLKEARRLSEGKQQDGQGNVNAKPADRTHSMAYAGDPGTFKVDWITWRCLPKDHGLSTEDSSSKLWQFVIANEAVIIGAWELDNDHGRMPYFCGESNPDQHTIWNPGNAEKMDGIQRMIDFAWNTHAEHLRKALHNAGLVHEDLVDIETILYPTPGGHVRVSDEVAERVLNGGMQLGSAFHQLMWPDATKGHLDGAMWLYEFGMRLMATNDPAQGMPTEDKRTLGEVQAIMQSSSARVASDARITDAQCFAPLFECEIANLQQYMTMSRYVRILGDYVKEFGTELAEVHPTDIYGGYDYVPIDGTLPPDPARLASTIMELISTAGGIPQLNGQVPLADRSIVQFNYHKAFKQLGSNLGFTNTDDFLEVIGQAPTVLPDEQIEAGVAAGNMVTPDELGVGLEQLQ